MIRIFFHFNVTVAKNKNFVEAVRKSPVSVLEGAICFLSIWSILGLAGFHTYLISVNKTTNEDIKVTFSSKRGSGLRNPYTTHNLFTNCCLILCGPNAPSLIDRRSYYDPSSNTFVAANPDTSRATRPKSDYPYPRQVPIYANPPQPQQQLTQSQPNASQVYYGNYCEPNLAGNMTNDVPNLVHVDSSTSSLPLTGSASVGSIKSQMDASSQPQMVFSQSAHDTSADGFEDHFVASSQPTRLDSSQEKLQNQQLQQQMIQAMHQYVVRQSAV